MTDITFTAEMGAHASVIGQGIPLIAREGHFAGQIALPCQDDRLRGSMVTYG